MEAKESVDAIATIHCRPGDYIFTFVGDQYNHIDESDEENNEYSLDVHAYYEPEHDSGFIYAVPLISVLIMILVIGFGASRRKR